MKESIARLYRILFKAKELIGLIVFYWIFFSEPFFPAAELTFFTEDAFFDQKLNNESEYEIFSLVLSNSGTESIEDIELFANGVKELLSVGYTTSSRRVADRIGDSLEATEEGGRVYFKGLQKLPPGHNIRIQMLCDCDELFLTNRVLFKSSVGDDYRIIETAHVSGLWLKLSRWGYIAIMGHPLISGKGDRFIFSQLWDTH